MVQRSIAAQLGRPAWAYLGTPIVAGALWAELRSAPDLSAASLSLFITAPVALLAGFHARTQAYFHDTGRLSLLPLPLSGHVHLRSAVGAHLASFLASCGLAALALELFAVPRGWAAPLTVQWLWVCALMLPIEGVAVGAVASLGRPRSDRAAQELQRTLAGGWTRPDAGIHLWAPALTVGLATALALPGQLAIEHAGKGHEWPSATPMLFMLPLVVAIAGAAWGVRAYGRAVWPATSTLHEVVAALGGSAAPTPMPAVVRRAPIRLRLWLTRTLRLHALVPVRLLVCVGAASVAAMTDAPLQSWPLLVSATVLWLAAPLGQLWRDRVYVAPMPGPLRPWSTFERGAAAVFTVGPAALMWGVVLAKGTVA